MDKIELAEKMIEWRKKRVELDALEDEIKHAIMLNEESFTVADIVGRFNGGKKTFDYESAGKNAPPEIVKHNTKTEEKIDWKAVCLEAKIKEISSTAGNPSVTLNIKGDKKEESTDVEKAVASDDTIPF